MLLRGVCCFAICPYMVLVVFVAESVAPTNVRGRLDRLIASLALMPIDCCLLFVVHALSFDVCCRLCSWCDVLYCLLCYVETMLLIVCCVLCVVCCALRVVHYMAFGVYCVLFSSSVVCGVSCRLLLIVVCCLLCVACCMKPCGL